MPKEIYLLERISEALKWNEEVGQRIEAYVSSTNSSKYKPEITGEEDEIDIAGIISELVKALFKVYPDWVSEITRIYFEWISSSLDFKVSAAIEYFSALEIEETGIFSQVDVQVVSSKVICMPIDFLKLVDIGDRIGRSIFFAKNSRESAELTLNQFEHAVREHKKLKLEVNDEIQYSDSNGDFTDDFENSNTAEEILILLLSIVKAHPGLAGRAHKACYELVSIWNIEDKPSVIKTLDQIARGE